MDMKMKTCLVICLLNWLICNIFSEIVTLNIKPTVLKDVESPITTTTVSLEMPYCYFDSVLALCPEGQCYIVLVIATTSGPGKSNFDTSKILITYTDAFTPTGTQYFIIVISNGPVACPAVTPYNIIVGAEGACTAQLCNGALPEGRDMSFKYFMWTDKLVAETMWSDNVRLLTSTVNFNPVVSTDVSSSITVNTVSLQMPYCYFDSVNVTVCPDKSKCEVWLVSSLTSATSIYESSNSFLSEYPTAYTSDGLKYSTTLINTLDKITCPSEDPYNFLVGADGACSDSYCNGFLPDGENMSFKYVLAVDGDDLVATAWSDSITLKARKSPDSLGSGYAGRSGSMVAITTILSILTIILSILLIGALVLICGKKGKAN